MVTQDSMLALITSYPGHNAEEYAELYAKICIKDEDKKSHLDKKEVYDVISRLKRWEFLLEEWNFSDNGPKVHYYPNLSIKSDNSKHNETSHLEDYDYRLVRDRVSRGWDIDSASYSFPQRAREGQSYLFRFSKGIVNYIRKNDMCSFDDIAEYICKSHRRCSFVPKCILDNHLNAVITKLIQNQLVYCIDNKLTINKVKQ